MDINKLTSQFQQDLSAAQSIAIQHDHSVIEPIHVLQTMIQNDGSSVRNLLLQTKVDLVKVKQKLDQAIDTLAKVSSPTERIKLPVLLGISGSNNTKFNITFYQHT